MMRYKIQARIDSGLLHIGTVAGHPVLTDDIEFYVDVEDEHLKDQIESLAGIVADIKIVENGDGTAVDVHKARLAWETWVHGIIAESKDAANLQEFIYECTQSVGVHKHLSLYIDPIHA